MNDFTGRIRPDEWQPPVGLKRTLTVALDPAQYQADMTHMAAHRSEDVYSTFNLLMRRKPKVTPRYVATSMLHCQPRPLCSAVGVACMCR